MRKPSFSGEFIIDKYEVTKNYKLIHVGFSPYTDGKTLSSLGYVDIENEAMDLKVIGHLFISADFKKLSLSSKELGDRRAESPYENRIWISAPADSFEEAKKITQTISSAFK